MAHIILVEDDPRLSELIKNYLEQNAFEVTLISHGNLAVSKIKELSPDLVILDIMLPGKDGISICQEIRPDFKGPVLFLTARDTDYDQILGLEIGADDYVIKPVEPRVLLARVNSLLRRIATPKSQHTQLNFGHLSINKNSRKVSLAGEDIPLTSHEFDLLWLLASHSGETKSREYIHKKMIGREYDGLDRTVDVRVSHLRKKLMDNTESPTRIKTIWGKGYLFVADAWE